MRKLANDSVNIFTRNKTFALRGNHRRFVEIEKFKRRERENPNIRQQQYLQEVATPTNVESGVRITRSPNLPGPATQQQQNPNRWYICNARSCNNGRGIRDILLTTFPISKPTGPSL
jgi:hypothetical protein